jgi:hypothetical protein
MRKLLIVPLIILCYSCSPVSNGSLHQDNNGCTILTNTSSSSKISFILKYPTVDYKWEQTVGPNEDAILGCSEDAKTIQIIGASIKN